MKAGLRCFASEEGIYKLRYSHILIRHPDPLSGERGGDRIAFRAGATGLATIPLLELAAHRKALAGDVIGILRGAMERQSEDHPTLLQIG